MPLRSPARGELEQVRALLLEGLLQREKLSGAALLLGQCGKKCIGHQGACYPQNLRAYRLPLLTANPWGKTIGPAPAHRPRPHPVPLRLLPRTPALWIWPKSQALYFIKCLSQGERAWPEGHCSTASVLSLFQQIIPSTAMDRERLGKLLNHPTHPEIDLRVVRIDQRLQNSAQTFQGKNMQCYLQLIQKWPRKNRLLLGQFYPQEMAILGHPSLIKQIAEKELLVCICPHHLDAGELDRIQRAARQLSAQWQMHTSLQTIGHHDLHGPEQSLPTNHCHFHLLNMRGILCELYQFFDISYIGGGFHHSIHSVLEPYLAGTKVICGPRTHRSSEFELISHLDTPSLLPIQRPDDFFSAYEKMKKRKTSGRNRQFMDIMKQRYQKLEGELLHHAAQ